ncbi:MAG: hypothetical protein AMXMBFR22_20690 [Phycisphaerae bacterium]
MESARRTSVKNYRSAASRWKMALVVLTSGMILPGKCEVIAHDAFIDATKSTFVSLFDPERVADWLNLDGDVEE